MSSNTFTLLSDIDFPTLDASRDEPILALAKNKDRTEVRSVAVSFCTHVVCKACLLNRCEDGNHYYKPCASATFKNHKNHFHGQDPKNLQPNLCADYAANGYPVAPAAAAPDDFKSDDETINLTDVDPKIAAAIRQIMANAADDKKNKSKITINKHRIEAAEVAGGVQKTH